MSDRKSREDEALIYRPENVETRERTEFVKLARWSRFFITLVSISRALIIRVANGTSMRRVSERMNLLMLLCNGIRKYISIIVFISENNDALFSTYSSPSNNHHFPIILPIKEQSLLLVSHAVSPNSQPNESTTFQQVNLECLPSNII